ncbi:MAG: hypothetical protein IRZ14_17490 [Chloroflexi bacterium]|nr:hypothetical protein [Chloroflexota bacterium]
MTDQWARLVRLLAQLEDRLPFVTVATVQAHWSAEARGDAHELLTEIDRAVQEQRLFVDRRRELDPDSGEVRPVRLIRLNRRHPAVQAHLAEAAG